MVHIIKGKYKITRLIGNDEMASVYEAENEMIGTKVAIQVLNPILSANIQIKERFRNEAKLLESLDHPNITKVIDFDDQPKQLSIVKEYLNRENLNEKIERTGPLTEKEIVEIFSQTLSAFEFAHENGMFHGYLKPDDIFFHETEGEIDLSTNDLGVYAIIEKINIKILGFEKRVLFDNNYTSLIQNHGARAFITPEELMIGTDAIDYKSDIYCIGLILFYVVTGLKPNFYCGYKLNGNNSINPFPEYEYTDSQKKFKRIINKACQPNKKDRYDSFRVFKNEILNLSKHNDSIPKSRWKNLKKLFGYE
jgi:serine/threonine protein kinase